MCSTLRRGTTVGWWAMSLMCHCTSWVRSNMRNKKSERVETALWCVPRNRRVSTDFLVGLLRYFRRAEAWKTTCIALSLADRTTARSGSLATGKGGVWQMACIDSGQRKDVPNISRRILMKTKLWSLSTLAALLLMVGVSVYAQQSAPSTTPNDPTAQQPASAPHSQPGQTPEQSGQPAPDSQAQPTTSTSDSQTFTGTIVKSGDKYMLQDAASGKSYDIDHQG